MLKRNNIRTSFCYLVIALVLTGAVTAWAVYSEAKLNADDAGKQDSFGVSASISGDAVIVGASGNDVAGTGAGAAYVFRRTGGVWSQEQKLISSDGAPNDIFGSSVDISGDVLVVGAHWADVSGQNEMGAAYVFRYNGSSWVEEGKLTLSSGQASDLFGYRVGTTGTRVIVSAHGWSTAGAADIFRFNGTTWEREQRLTPSDGASGDQFGLDVDIHGKVAVVGAQYDDDDGTSSGSAYVYRYNGTAWAFDQKLTASDAAADVQFGNNVAVFGSVIAVGAYREDSNGTDSGAVYLFRHNGTTWVEDDKVTAGDAAADDLYGRYVAVGPDRLVVGSINDDDNGTDSGSVYIYKYDGSWTLDEKVDASDGAAGDLFGWMVAASGIDLAVASPNGSSGAVTDTGAVYVLNQSCGAGSTPAIWYPDFDGDGYGDRFSPMTLCAQGTPFVADGTDCEDIDPDVYPGVAEVCDDGLDNDCDGYFDDDDPDCGGSNGGGGGGGCNTTGPAAGDPLWPDLLWIVLLAAFVLWRRGKLA